MKNIIQHLTVNTGDMEHFDGVTPADQLELVRPLIDGGGPIPNRRPYRVVLIREEGAVAFSIYRGDVPITLNLLVWTPQAVRYWETIEDHYQLLSDNFPGLMDTREIPQRPEKLPWLATVLLPTCVFAGSDIFWIAAFERIFAEAQLEAVGFGANQPERGL